MGFRVEGLRVEVVRLMMTICRAAISVTMLYGSALVIPSMAILLLLPTSHHGHLWSSSQLWWCAGTSKFRVLAQAETCKFGGEALTARKVGNLPFLRCSLQLFHGCGVSGPG